MLVFKRILVLMLIIATMPVTMPLYGIARLIQNILNKKLEKYTVSYTIRGVPVIFVGGMTGTLASIFLTYGSPAMATRSIIGNFVTILRPVNFGILYHELAHMLYEPAMPSIFMSLDPLGAMHAHYGKGARFEHQADKWAVNELIKEGRVEYVREYIDVLNKALGDGKYRARMLTRYIRRYHGISM